VASSSPFHSGEQRAQERAGVRDRIERMGQRMLRDFMPEEHREFFEQLPWLIVGSLDASGRPWASILFGEPGFVTSPHARALIVGALPVAGDPLAQNLVADAPVGVLGIELPTRRRNRANGHVVWVSGRGFELAVEQCFGNCKQYIHAREGARQPAQVTATHGASLLDAQANELLARCDTAFVASASARPGERGREGVDVSHRGGLPGFIRVTVSNGTTRLTLPDYRGNFMFNTLGNVEVNPRAGLLAADFARGDLLSMTCRARVRWDGPELAAFPGAERLLELELEEYVFLAGGLGARWSEPELAREFR
jgi:predicted pyridoxine 5'-phosphate oxidase superfamily flavin-nucleotide-binding protein